MHEQFGMAIPWRTTLLALCLTFLPVDAQYDPCIGQTCPDGQQCVTSSDGYSFVCIDCPATCPRRYWDYRKLTPVCGADGHTYASECELLMTACEYGTEIAVKYSGHCNPCAHTRCSPGTTCIVDANRNAHCCCKDVCPSMSHAAFVCGSDGYTYPTACDLQRRAYLDGLDVIQLHLGRCDIFTPCKHKICKHGQYCVAVDNVRAECRCRAQCQPMYDPVCGSDGITYDNICQLHLRNCESVSDYITEAFKGICTHGGSKVVGQACKYHFECMAISLHSHCNHATCVCTCDRGYAYDKVTQTCKRIAPPTLPIGLCNPCTSDHDCAPLHSICMEGVCKCEAGYEEDCETLGVCVPYSNNKSTSTFSWTTGPTTTTTTETPACPVGHVLIYREGAVVCIQVPDPCDLNPCVNQGKCKVTSDGNYACDCPPCYNGENCANFIAINTIPHIQPGGFVSVAPGVPIRTIDDLPLEIKFKFFPLSKDGLIFYQDWFGEDQIRAYYLRVALQSGCLDIVLNIGPGDVRWKEKKPCESGFRISLQEWNDFSIELNLSYSSVFVTLNHNATMNLGGARLRYAREGLLSQKLSDPPAFFLGAHTDEFGTTSVFNGAIANVFIKDRFIDLRVNTSRNGTNIITEASRVVPFEHPCSAVPCQNGGSCFAMDRCTLYEYNCTCPEGFEGFHCEISNTGITDSQDTLHSTSTEITTEAVTPVTKFNYSNKSISLPKFSDNYNFLELDFPRDAMMTTEFMVQLIFSNVDVLTSPSGILLYMGADIFMADEDYFVVCLNNSYLNLIYMMGDASTTLRISRKVVRSSRTGEPNVLHVGYQFGRIYMDFRNEHNSTDVLVERNFGADAKLYLGGVRYAAHLAPLLKDICGSRGFNGTIQHFSIGSTDFKTIFPFATASSGIDSQDVTQLCSKCPTHEECAHVLNMKDKIVHCACRHAFSGEFCNETVVESEAYRFDGATFYNYSSAIQKNMTGTSYQLLAIRFKTEKSKGLLVQQGDFGDAYWALGINLGFLNFTYTLQRSTGRTTYFILSMFPVSDGYWHTAQIFVNDPRIVTLDIDGITSSASLYGMNLPLSTNKPVFLGGLPESYRLPDLTGAPTFASYNYSGCFELVDVLSNVLRIKDISPASGTQTIFTCS